MILFLYTPQKSMVVVGLNLQPVVYKYRFI